MIHVSLQVNVSEKRTKDFYVSGNFFACFASLYMLIYFRFPYLFAFCCLSTHFVGFSLGNDSGELSTETGDLLYLPHLLIFTHCQVTRLTPELALNGTCQDF